MLDMALTFPFKFVVVGLLWWTVRRSTVVQGFWVLLAAAWTLNLLGNGSWGAHEALTGDALPVFSYVDGLYMARYALLFLALRHRSGRVGRRQWGGAVVVIAAVSAIIWSGWFEPAQVSAKDALTYFLGRALYLVLDAALIFVALTAWAQAAASYLRNIVGLLVLALIVYGAANWVNYSAGVYASGMAPGLAEFFWALSDVFIGLAAWCGLRQDALSSSP